MTEQKDEQLKVTEQRCASSLLGSIKVLPQWWRALMHNVVVIALLLLGFTFLFMVRAAPLVMHEIFGLVVLAIVILHVYLLRSFFSFVGSERQAVFIYRDIVLLGLIISFVLTLWSGLCISHILFKGVFISHENFGFWRRMHTFASAYFLLFIGLHLGCYLLKFGSWLSESLSQVLSLTINLKPQIASSDKANIERKEEGADTNITNAITAVDTTISNESHYANVRIWLERGLLAGLVLICINGAIQSVQGSFYSHLLCQRSFSFYDYERPWILNAVDQLSIIALFMAISGLIYWALLRCSQPKDKA